ncbi:MAG: hypothetical protein WC227_01700 [Patescibacteria group bacterium]|jgi:hypothetical protein
MLTRNQKSWICFRTDGSVVGNALYHDSIAQAISSLDTGSNMEYFLTLRNGPNEQSIACTKHLDHLCYLSAWRLIPDSIRYGHTDAHTLYQLWLEYYCGWQTEQQYKESFTRLSCSDNLKEALSDPTGRHFFLRLLHTARRDRIDILRRTAQNLLQLTKGPRLQLFELEFARIVTPNFKLDLTQKYWERRGITGKVL